MTVKEGARNQPKCLGYGQELGPKWVGYIPLPSSGKHCGSRGGLNEWVIWYGDVQQTYVFWNNITDTLMFSLQLWFPAQDLCKIVPVNISTRMGKDLWGPICPWGTIGNYGCWERDFIFLNVGLSCAVLIPVNNHPHVGAKKLLIKLCGSYTKRRQESKRGTNWERSCSKRGPEKGG